MQEKPPKTIEEVLDLDYTREKDKLWLTEQDTLRKLVGVLGMLLPLLLYFVVYFDSGFESPLYSISHYYFTRASSVFAVILSLLAVFLLIYKGKEPIDFYFSAIAGIFALCVVLFPTSSIIEKCDDTNLYALTILKPSGLRVNVHYYSAAIFLSCLAYMSLFLFTKSDKKANLRGMNKRRRNRIFRTCGVIMVIAMLGIVANFAGLIPEETFEKYHLMFWCETIAVEAFGVSWLVKAEVILKG